MRGSGRGRVFVVALAASLVAAAGAGASVVAVQSATTTSTSTTTTTTPAPPPPLTLAQCRSMYQVSCYSAAQLEQAYDLHALYAQGLNGHGSTIVIVDPLGSPTIGNDLHTFDQLMALPDPPVLRVIQPVGAVPPFNLDGPEEVAKAGETTLDVEWAHAIAPGADILLVETPTIETSAGGGFRQLMRAEDYVIKHNLGDVISQSFSLPEQNLGRALIGSLHRTYIRATHHHVTVLAATNDNGVTGPLRDNELLFHKHRVVQWPATDPLVTAVGGTHLHLNARGNRVSPDTVWNDTFNPNVMKNLLGTSPPYPWAASGGVSLFFGRPSYQRSVKNITGNRRGVPDVTMSAASSGSVLIYESFTAPKVGWLLSGGTSEATPEFAGIVAIADQYARQRLGKRRLGPINAALYQLERRHAPGIVDITRGNNTVSFVEPSPGGPLTFTVKGYRATPGYDLASGVGTIDAAKFVPELARAG